MGRTDLARFRKNAPSTVPPVDLPPSVIRLVQTIETHSDGRAVQAIQSLSHASSQRDQVSAIKLLGVALKQTYQYNSSKTDLSSCQTVSVVTSESLGGLIEQLLSVIVFDIPEATPGLVSTALRAILRCTHAPIIFGQHRESFFDRLENINRTCAVELPSGKCSVNIQLHKRLASDMNAVAAMLPEAVSKHWIFNYSSRLVGVGYLLSYLTDMHIILLGNTVSAQGSNTLGTALMKSNDNLQSGQMFFNISLTVSACESSMKVAQDLTNFLSSVPGECAEIDQELRESLVCRIYHSCSRLLKIDSIPRSCSLACAVALVTSQVLLHQNYTSKTQLLAALHADVLASIPLYPPFSQLSLLRAVLEAPLCKPAIPEILFHSSTFAEEAGSHKTTVFDILAALITESSDLHFRYLATDTMISCIRAVAPFWLDKQCRDAILHLVYLRWEEPFAGTPTQIREIVEALVSVDGQDEDSKHFWLGITENLVSGSWLSKGMYAPLCALVKRVGAIEILKIQPNCQSLAMHAAATNSHLTKAASDWLEKFWAVLIEEYDYDSVAFVQSTAPPLLYALLNDDPPSLRERTAEHILPLYIKCCDKGSISKRANRILSWLSTSEFTVAQRVRGMIIIASVARKQGVELRCLSDRATVDLIRQGLSSSEEDLRSFAFDLVVTTSSQTEPIKQVELDLILCYIPIALMPGASPSDRSRFKQSMRRFFERFAACRKSAVEGSGGWWARERKQKYGGLRTTELDRIRIALLERLSVFEKRCLEMLMGSSYPGASCLRRTSAFEVMLSMSRNLGTSLTHTLLKPSSSEPAVASFISALFDDWERPRRAAYDYVSSLPSPLPGVSPLSKAENLQVYAKKFLDSPRQNCVDSGALLIRILFQKHVSWQDKSDDNCPTDGNQNAIMVFTKKRQSNALSNHHFRGDPIQHPEITYCMEILDSIEERIDTAKNSFLEACRLGLFHGRFLLLRYILQDFPWSKSRTVLDQTHWRALVQRLVDLCEQCLRIALHGVSFQKFNETVTQQDDGFDDVDDEDGRDPIFLNDGVQLESTGCFLSAKEICIVLGVLCNQIRVNETSGLEDDSGDHDGAFAIFTRIGELFCYVFTNTRHWGVIDGATEGMQLLCERVLSSFSTHLRRLPSKWVSQILLNALEGKLYVLRRSAGIPWLITAAVNAEASINRKSHDSPLLNSVMRALLGHLERRDIECILKGEDKVGGSDDEKQGKSIESAAHVLNFLRSLFLNSNIAGNMLQYMEKAIMHCITSFHSKRWLIRNSAMMLYSALIRRGIGVCRERRGHETGSSFKAAGGTSGTLDGEKRMTTTTTFQFFSRHPNLIPFLLSHLQNTVYIPQSTLASSQGSMYPTLYLLSCLSPDANKDPTLCASISAFWPVVRKCSHWHVEYVRRAAAAATVPLIDDYSAVPAIVQNIIQSGLPSEPVDILCPSGSTNEMEKPIAILSVKQNHLHGDLLTLVAILQNVQDMAGKDKVALMNVCIELLPSRIWISVHKLKNRCSVTRASMFELLSLCHDIAWGVWRERKCNTSTELLRICNMAASKIDVNEICFKTPESEVGAPVLRINAIRFLARTLLWQCHNDITTVEDSLNQLMAFVQGQDKETFVSAVESSVRLLQLFDEGNSRVRSNSTDEMSALLQQAWDLMNTVIQRRDNAEEVIAALDFMSCILEVCRTHPVCAISYENSAIDVIFVATNDACIDVCERALVVSGQWIERNGLDDMSLRTWMTTVVRACTSQTPSLRMAGCTSLFKSGFAFASTESILKKNVELFVQARLVWSSLLEDESSEVRKHALKFANNYTLRDSEDELDVHILPCLMKTYSCIRVHFPASQVLFYRLKQCLGILPEYSRNDGLLSLIAKLISVSDETREQCFFRDAIANNPKLQKNRHDQLFRLETQCGGGETVLHMQLLAWTYAKILLYQRESLHQTAGDSSAHQAEEVREVLSDLGFNELNHLRRAVAQSCSSHHEHGPIYSKSLTAEGFAHIMRHVLRVFLVAHCALMHGPTSCVDYLHENLEHIISEHCELVHPVLTMAMSAVTKVVRPDKLPQQTLFLLPLESVTLDHCDG